MLLRPDQKRQILDLSIQIDKNNIECVKKTVFQVLLTMSICHGSLTFLAIIEKYQNQ